MRGLCWPGEELRLRGGASLWSARQKTQLFLMNAGKQTAGINRAAHEHYRYAIKSMQAQTGSRVQSF